MSFSGPVALFRALDDAARTGNRLGRLGVTAVFAPVTELRPVETALPSGRFDFALASSAKAFDFASAEVIAAVGRMPVHVVGEKTAAAARARGLAVAAIAPDVAELGPQLRALAGQALYLAGRDRKPDLEAALAGRVSTLVVYEARERVGWSAGEAAAVASAAAALHYSERGATLAAEFAEGAGIGPAFRRLRHVCMARQVAAPLGRLGAARAFWPQTPTESALFETLENVLAD